jgi:hypothetical protein
MKFSKRIPFFYVLKQYNILLSVSRCAYRVISHPLNPFFFPTSLPDIFTERILWAWHLSQQPARATTPTGTPIVGYLSTNVELISRGARTAAGGRQEWTRRLRRPAVAAQHSGGLGSLRLTRLDTQPRTRTRPESPHCNHR